MSLEYVEESEVKLSELIDQLEPGDGFVITRDRTPVARLIGVPKPSTTPRQLGSMRGTVTYMADDFNAPVADFKDYQ